LVGVKFLHETGELLAHSVFRGIRPNGELKCAMSAGKFFTSLLAEAMLDNAVLKDITARKW
jgi:hypothetical protein